jgi:hypothetical protein
VLCSIRSSCKQRSAWTGSASRDACGADVDEGKMRVALAQKLGGIDSVELGELRHPEPTAGQALIRVHAAVSACGTLGSSPAVFLGSLCRSSQARKSLAS